MSVSLLSGTIRKTLAKHIRFRRWALKLFFPHKTLRLTKLISDLLEDHAIWLNSLNEEELNLFFNSLFDNLLEATASSPERHKDYIATVYLVGELIDKEIEKIEMSRKKTIENNTATEKTFFFLQTIQWLLTAANFLLCAGLLASTIFLPALVLPLGILLLILRTTQIGIGAKGLLIKPSFNKSLNLLALTSMSPLLLASLLAPPLAVPVGIAIAITIAGIEAVKVVREAAKLIQYFSSDYKDKTEYRKIQRKLIMHGIKLTAAAITVAAAISIAVFFPLALPATGIIASAVFTTFAIYKLMSNEKILKPATEKIRMTAPYLYPQNPVDGSGDKKPAKKTAGFKKNFSSNPVKSQWFSKNHPLATISVENISSKPRSTKITHPRTHIR